MAKFQPAWEVLRKEEGGLVDHPNDPGGITNYGISLRWAARAAADRDRDGFTDTDIDKDGDVDADDIRNISEARAAWLFENYWWREYHYGRITDQTVATRIFSMAVNMGARQSHVIAQRAVQACTFPVLIDGILGPKSRQAIECSEPNALMAAIRAEQAGFYRVLHAKYPERFGAFIKGWLNRAYA